MELRTYLKTNFIGTEKAVHEKVMNEMKDFFDKLESADADPQSIYYTWIKGNRSEMAKIGRILLNEYGIITNPIIIDPVIRLCNKCQIVQYKRLCTK